GIQRDSGYVGPKEELKKWKLVGKEIVIQDLMAEQSTPTYKVALEWLECFCIAYRIRPRDCCAPKLHKSMSVNSRSLDDLNKQRRISEDERKEEREANAVVQATRRSQQTSDERHVERNAV
ncbi:hypothetical protein F444_19003, partial [Phytophthora nicotianae P1976]